MNAATVIAVVVVVVVIVVAWVAVRKRHPRGNIPAPPVVGVGWQFYDRPTELEPPGTIFRIDEDRHRYIVDTLNLPPTTGREAVGRHEGSIQSTMALTTGLLGLDVSAEAKASNIETFIFELDEATRAFLADVDLDAALKPWTTDHDLREGSRYYIIREALSAGKITYRLNQRQRDNLGGEAELAKLARLDGKLHASRASTGFKLARTFAPPMRVMFLAEEIRPLTRGFAEETVVGRRPIRKPLVWDVTSPDQ